MQQGATPYELMSNNLGGSADVEKFGVVRVSTVADPVTVDTTFANPFLES